MRFLYANRYPLRSKTLWNGGSPRIAHNTLAGVGIGDVGELAFEGRRSRPAVQPLYLGGARDQRGVMGLRRAVDDECRARQRLEQRGNVAVGIEIVRPGGAAA